MKKIGLTGNIGSGKSTIAEAFKILGIPVFNSDFEAKRLMGESAALKQSLLNLFGTQTYQHGKLNTGYLSKIVFSDEKKLKLLNDLIHPELNNFFESWCKLQDSNYIIKEAAILFESGSYTSLDDVICVSCPKDLRIRRIIKRDSTTTQAVLDRMKNQWDEDKLISLSTYVINNDETTLLFPQILAIHQQLK